MTSDAQDVDAYLDQVPKERRQALETIRALVRDIYSDFDEDMTYGMPSYGKDGVVHVGFNSQRQAISLYVLKEGVVNRYRDRFAKSAVGKGCIRYRNPDKIDFELMRQILQDSYDSDEVPC